MDNYYANLYSQVTKGKPHALEELIECATKGDSEAQFLLSCIYDEEGRLHDFEKSELWLRKAAANGHELAIMKLSSEPEVTNDSEITDETANSEESDNDAVKNHCKRKTTEDSYKSIWWFHGRIDRTTYAVYLFFLALVIFIVRIFCYLILDGNHDVFDWRITFAAIMYAHLVILGVWLYLALKVKRCHDVGKSSLWAIIPFLGIALLFWPGEEGENKYGPQPK